LCFEGLTQKILRKKIKVMSNKAAILILADVGATISPVNFWRLSGILWGVVPARLKFLSLMAKIRIAVRQKQHLTFLRF